MSYRTVKRTLGETALERKCRWLFGGCLLVLISTSFWWYGSRTIQQVHDRNRFVGEALANAALVEAHMNKQEDQAPIQAVDARIADMLRLGTYRWQVLLPKNDLGEGQPEDEKEHVLLEQWSKLGAQLTTDEQIQELGRQWSHELIPHAQKSGVQTSKADQPDLQDTAPPLEESSWVYRYYEPVFAKEGCIFCHSKPTGMKVFWPNLRVGDLLAVVRVELDANEMKADQAANTGLLVTTGLVTVFLAMVASYVIVRYVIVKPLRHLRDVSNAVRQGDVEQRAVIHTGDEFEELGAAFNRMLRQLLRKQDELQSVNDELDGKLDELAQANLRLFEMNQLKSDFLATVSHELRTPLNSIIGFSDLLGGIEQLNDKQQRYATNIQHSGRQLLEMINDILDLAKIESGKLQVRISDFDIGAIVATQCDMARPLSERKNIDLNCSFSPGLPPIRQDQGKLEQILNNLLSNAIKFTPDGGRIDVTAVRDAHDDLRLTVADTGVGISEEEQQLVFEKFRQGTSVLPGGNAMTREYSGTGLGLSIVRELCRLLGGDITLVSELGKGSEFTIHLPWRLTEVPKVESPLEDELNELTKPRSDLPIIAPASSKS